jgi:pyruvate dehydrogenase (quinone)
MRQDLGFESIHEIDYDDVFKGCSAYCEMIVTPEQARRKAVAACQAALTRRGVPVLVVPADVANAAPHDELPYVVHARRPLTRPSDADLDEIAAILNKRNAVRIYAGAGCADAHDEVVATAARLQAPMVHTSRGKDILEYDNPYNVGMTGIIGYAPSIMPFSTVMCCSCSGRISPGANAIQVGRRSSRSMSIPGI